MPVKALSVITHIALSALNCFIYFITSLRNFFNTPSVNNQGIITNPTPGFAGPAHQNCKPESDSEIKALNSVAQNSQEINNQQDVIFNAVALPGFVGIQELKRKQAEHLAKLQILGESEGWEHLREHTLHPDSGFDWWMFPTDRTSIGQGDKYRLSEKDIEHLKVDSEFMESYRAGVQLVLSSWGWDADSNKSIANEKQKWTNYDVRLGKMIHSLFLFKETELLQSVEKFCTTNNISPPSWANQYFKKAELAPPQISAIHKVADGLYAGESKAQTGEKIYIGLEILDAAREKQWEGYRHAASARMRYFLEKEEGYNRWGQGIRDRELIEMMHLAPGIGGWLNPAEFVVYVSKTPIEGRLALPDTTCQPFSSFVPASFSQNYPDLVMSISGRLVKDKPLVEMRGIFRNPQSIVEGGYKGVAMHLPLFAIQIVSSEIAPDREREITHLTVAPMDKMRELLINTFGRSKIQIEEEIPRSLYIPGSGIQDKVMLIPFSAI